MPDAVREQLFRQAAPASNYSSTVGVFRSKITLLLRYGLERPIITAFDWYLAIFILRMIGWHFLFGIVRK